jgi:hypothetical protein
MNKDIPVIAGQTWEKRLKIILYIVQILSDIQTGYSLITNQKPVI